MNVVLSLKLSLHPILSQHYVTKYNSVHPVEFLSFVCHTSTLQANPGHGGCLVSGSRFRRYPAHISTNTASLSVHASQIFESYPHWILTSGPDYHDFIQHDYPATKAAGLHAYYLVIFPLITRAKVHPFLELLRVS